MTELISLRFLRKDSTSYELRFGAYDSIKIVKQKVAEVSGIDVSKVQLMFESLTLEMSVNLIF